MRILIFAQWYPPEPAILLQELAQTLQSFGHSVEVLTGFPNYPSGTLYPGYSIRLRQREVLAGVPLVRVPLYPEHSRSGLRRALNYGSFALSAAILGPWFVKRPDVIFVYHPPLTVGFPAWVLSRLWRAPFVYQVQDLWPETLSATGMLGNRRALDVIERVARWVYRRATAILVISPGFRESLLKKGVPADKLRFVPNWADTDMYCAEAPDTGLAEHLGLAGKFNVMFAGNVGEAQGLETVVEAATLLASAPAAIQFVIVGDGVALERLKASVREKGLRNVRFLGRFAESEMPGLFALADALLVHLRDDPLFRITIPHKILAYLASGKPIIAAVAGDAAAVVTAANAGITCPPQNPEALASAVHGLSALPLAERQAMGARARRTAETEFSRAEVIRRIEAILQEAVDRRA